MKPISKDILKKAAHRMMFDMDEEQYDTLLEEFSIFIKQLDLIAEVPHVDEAEPMTFPFDVTNDYLRADVVQDNIDKKDALKNSKTVKDGQISVPKVV